jgi:AP-3 complex subunit beta
MTSGLFQVVLAVSRVFHYAGAPSASSKIVHPILRLLNISKEVERVVLADVVILAKKLPVCHDASLSVD